ncbi:MAG: hypothetical protein CMJ45_08955 [Planctomyces sp.]|nr:hypothetical protein [Planctomyces sp.]
MCGRFTLTSNLDDLQGRFQFEALDLDYRPSYNIAPTQQVLTVTNDGQRRAQLMRWGLVPFWAKDLKAGNRMINAVGETVAVKPAFRSLIKKRRCLILADGFFEWRKEGKEKIPTYIFRKSKEAFALAGLWDTWKSPEGEVIQSCTILTTTPNGFISPIHNRMPVLLSGEAEALWLDPVTEDAATVTPLLVPCPAEELDSFVVSQLVNSPKNNVPECVLPVG